MMTPPTMAPGIEVKPPRMSTGSALSAMICSENSTCDRAPHMIPVVSATMPAANHTITQICSSEMPTESAALWLSATARSDVDLLQRYEAAEHLHVDRAARQVKLVGDHDLRLAAEHQLPEADEKIGDAEGRHEQDDVGLVDERAQHQALDRVGERQHHQDRQRQREERGNAERMQGN